LIERLVVAGIASFQPKTKGTYTVEVTQDGKAIGGSPFKISIDDHHVSSGQKVKVAGHIKDGMANQWNDVTVNIGEAGASSRQFCRRTTPICRGVDRCKNVGGSSRLHSLLVK